MSGMEIALIVSTAVSAYSSYQGGQAQSAGYKGMAQGIEFQTREKAVAYREQGNKVLRNVLEAQATITARAGAGGIDPFSGSAGSLQTRALDKGAQEFFLATENALLAEETGRYQAAQYRAAAKNASRAGTLNALAKIGTGAFMYSQLGGLGDSAFAGTSSDASTWYALDWQ